MGLCLSPAISVLKKFPHEILHGSRIELRRHELGVAREMFRLVDSDRVRLGRFLPWVVGMHSVAEEEEYVRFSHVEWEEYRVFDFGIFFEGRFVGSCGSHHMSWEDECCEVGYWIAGAYEGRGLISEAVGLLEAELLRLGFFRIEIRCDPKNLRSAAVPKRCGYELEAILKSHKIEQGERRDTMIWSKLR